jgi:hypothetical protein
MSGLDDSERTYRVIDGIYRLHRDLFEIENVLTRGSRLQLRLARISINGRMGTVVAGMLVIVPILISLGDIRWGSAPAIAIYCLAGSVILLWIYQIVSAGQVDNELRQLESDTATEALEDRLDFVFEEANAWVTRHRLVENIIKEAAAAAAQADPSAKKELEAKSVRYREILQSCEGQIAHLIKTSEKLVAAGRRPGEVHAELLDWCAAIPRFAPPSAAREPGGARDSNT